LRIEVCNGIILQASDDSMRRIVTQEMDYNLIADNTKIEIEDLTEK